MILNSNKYIGFDPDYHTYSKEKDEHEQFSDINQILKEDSELERLSLQDIYQEIDKRKDIYGSNASGLQELNCQIGTRLFDFQYRPYCRERISLEAERRKLELRMFDERNSYFRDTLRLRELVLNKRESIRDEDSGLMGRMMM